MGADIYDWDRVHGKGSYQDLVDGGCSLPDDHQPGCSHVRKKIIAFDVDGLLFDAEGRPRRDMIGILLALEPYCRIWVWSGSGADYARVQGERLFLPPSVEYRAKAAGTAADVCFDDEHVKLAEVSIRA